MVVLAISVMLNWGKNSDGTLEPPALFAAEPGTCLNWTAADARDIREMQCSQPYLFQVTGKADLTRVLGEDAAFPSSQRWQQLKQQHCGTVASRFFNGRFDPNGRFSVGAFTPSRQAWDSGDRAMQCGVQQPSPSGVLYRVQGGMRQLDQSNIYDPGRCLGINGKAVWDPVDCSRPHSVEVTGTVDLGERFKQGYPRIADQDPFLSTRCTELTAQYAGGPAVAKEKNLVVYWDTLTEESWQAGSRQVNCKLSARLPDGSGLAPVTGSVRGDVKIGTEPAPESKSPIPPGAPATETR